MSSQQLQPLQSLQPLQPLQQLQPLQPFIKWAGGKRAIMGELEVRFPKKWKNYHEPFLGGGAVMMHLQQKAIKDTSRHNGNMFCSDISEPLIIVYKVIKDNVEDLITELQKDEYLWQENDEQQRKNFMSQRDAFNRLKLKAWTLILKTVAEAKKITTTQLMTDIIAKEKDAQAKSNTKEFVKQTGESKTSKVLLENVLTLPEKISMAALFIFLNKTGFNGMYRENALGLYNIPPGSSTTKKTKEKNVESSASKKHKPSPTIYEPELLRSLSRTWKEIDTQFTCQSFEAVLMTAEKDDFVYLDPPYDADDKQFTAYNGSGFAEVEQKRLQEFFKELTGRGCFVMMSNSGTKRIKDLYNLEGVTIESINVKRCINSKGDQRSIPVEEVIIR